MAKRTSDPHQSWLPEANKSTADFPLTHLPYGAFEFEGQQHLCVAIGAHLLDLHACASAGLLPPTLVAACQAPTLNPFLSFGHRSWTLLRETITSLLHADVESDRKQAAEAALHSIAGATLQKPIYIPNYTDFYASIHHATRVGQLFRPDQPLLPNYKHIPIGYHGRASSIIVSGDPVVRPIGQSRPPQEEAQPNFLPSSKLDYELELALYIGEPSALGIPVPISTAATHIFGISLLNDWSARDIQSWEYQPLGPFLAKSFATSVSPWVMPMAAFAPFRVGASPRTSEDPAPLAYLLDPQDQECGAIDLTLEASLLTPRMRAEGMAPHRLSRAG